MTERIKRNSLILVLILAGTLPAADRFRDRYGIIEEKNIFLKDRSKKRELPATTQPTTQEAPKPIEASFVLTGIVADEAEYKAIIEDTSAGKILVLSVGSAVARGKISEIDIDQIGYGVGPDVKWIPVGQTLLGTLFDPTGVAVIVPSSDGTPGGINLNDPNLTQEQKMKLRRQMELNR